MIEGFLGSPFYFMTGHDLHCACHACLYTHTSHRALRGGEGSTSSWRRHPANEGLRSTHTTLPSALHCHSPADHHRQHAPVRDPHAGPAAACRGATAAADRPPGLSVRAHRGHLPLAYLPPSPDGQRRGDAGTPAAHAELLLLSNRLLHDPPNAPGGGTWPWPRTILHVSTHGWSRRMHA